MAAIKFLVRSEKSLVCTELDSAILHIVTSLFKPRAKARDCCLALSLVPLRPQRDCNSPAGDDHPPASDGVPGARRSHRSCWYVDIGPLSAETGSVPSHEGLGADRV
jgi:hypothetical protein